MATKASAPSNPQVDRGWLVNGRSRVACLPPVLSGCRAWAGAGARCGDAWESPRWPSKRPPWSSGGDNRSFSSPRLRRSTDMDVLDVAIEVLFTAILVSTVVAAVRRRDPLMRDVALIFSGLGFVFLLDVIKRAFGATPPVVGIVAAILFL